MKIITLVENTLSHDSTLEPQHGISLFIEYNGRNILFDTGSTDLFIKNSERMNISLSNVDYVIISHSHYDHGGGLKNFFSINSRAKALISNGAFSQCYAKAASTLYKYIGLDTVLLKETSERIVFIDRKLDISPGITIINNSCNEHERPSGNSRLFLKQEGKYVPDTFQHELITVFENHDGSLTLLTGCSHNGILNMLSSVEEAFPGKRISNIIGGFHLMNPITKKMSEKIETVKEIANNLKSRDIDKIYTGHCTGDEAFDILKKSLGNRIDMFKTGTVMEF